MINKIDYKAIVNLRTYLNDIKYGEVLQNVLVANNFDFSNCISDYSLLKRLMIFVSGSKILIIYKLFLLGQRISIEKLKCVMENELIDSLIRIGFLKVSNDYIFTDNYMIIYINGFYFVIDIPFYFLKEKCNDLH